MKELVLSSLSATQAKTQKELIEALHPRIGYGHLLILLRILSDEGQIVGEQMETGHFKWRLNCEK